MARVRRFEAEDVGKVEAGPLDFVPPVEVMREYRGLAWTAVEGGDVLGCAGIFRHEGIWYAWCVLSDRLRARPFLLHRMVARRLLTVVRELRTLPLYAMARTDHEPAHHWLLALGFRPVDLLTDYPQRGIWCLRYGLFHVERQ